MGEVCLTHLNQPITKSLYATHEANVAFAFAVRSIVLFLNNVLFQCGSFVCSRNFNIRNVK